MSTTIGQFDDYRAELDATGALGSERLLYRVTVGWRDSQGIVDFNYAKDFAPTVQLQWQATDATSIRFIGEYVEHEGNPLSQDAFFIDGDFIDAPKSNYYGFLTDYEEKESTGVQLHVDHQFSDALKLRAQAGWKDGGRDAGNSGYVAALPFPIPGFNDPASGLLFRSAFDQRREAESEYAALHLAWDVELGGTTHALVAGVNYSQSEITNIGFFNTPLLALPAVFAGDVSALASIPPSVNIFDPQTVAYDHFTNFNDSPPFGRDIWQYDNLGLNLQDAIDIPALNLHILLGLRYAESGAETIESVTDTGAPGTGFGPDTEESAWIPRVGVVYDLTDSHSIYASYGESFLPPFTNSRDRNGNPITDAEVGEQVEIGYRGEFFDGGLSATVAVFDLSKQNVIVPTGTPDVADLAGEQRSRGLEVDVTGRVTDYWDLFLSYAYVDTEVIDAGTADQTAGQRFPGTPLHKAVLWNNLSLDWAGLRGVSVGYGIDYMSESDADGLVNPLTLTFGPQETPAQGVVHNANITYERETDFGTFNAVLGINNLTDREYVLNTANLLFARRGERRTVMLTTTLTF
ncbi:MAG: TonB-dependent receptor [Pseudomonadota bacterium]